jgi:hypothetical protein
VVPASETGPGQPKETLVDDPRLARLLDHQAIVDVTIAYTWALDTRQFDDLRSVFLPDATAMLGRECNGVDDIITRISGALGPLDESQHLIGNHHVEVDGDRATCRCYLQAQHVLRSAEGGPNHIIAGRYDDELERTPDGWRIRHRSLTVMWTEGNPRVTRRAG